MLKFSDLNNWSRPRKQALARKAMEKSVALGSWVVGWSLFSVILSLGARGARVAIQFALGILTMGPLWFFMFTVYGAARIARELGFGMWSFKACGWIDEKANRVDDAVRWCGSAWLDLGCAMWCLPVLGWVWSLNLSAHIAAARSVALAGRNAWGLNAYGLAWLAKVDSRREIWSERNNMGWGSFHPDDGGLALSAAHPMGWCGWLMGGGWRESGLAKAKGSCQLGPMEWAAGVDRLLQARALRRELSEEAGAVESAGRSAPRL